MPYETGWSNHEIEVGRSILSSLGLAKLWGHYDILSSCTRQANLFDGWKPVEERLASIKAPY